MLRAKGTRVKTEIEKSTRTTCSQKDTSPVKIFPTEKDFLCVLNQCFMKWSRTIAKACIRLHQRKRKGKLCLPWAIRQKPQAFQNSTHPPIISVF